MHDTSLRTALPSPVASTWHGNRPTETQRGSDVYHPSAHYYSSYLAAAALQPYSGVMKPFSLRQTAAKKKEELSRSRQKRTPPSKPLEDPPLNLRINQKRLEDFLARSSKPSAKKTRTAD
jgi:hypothetical protein